MLKPSLNSAFSGSCSHFLTVTTVTFALPQAMVSVWPSRMALRIVITHLSVYFVLESSITHLPRGSSHHAGTAHAILKTWADPTATHPTQSWNPPLSLAGH